MNNDINDFLNSMLKDDEDYEDNNWTKAASDGFGSPLLNVAMNTILQPEYSNLYAYSSIQHAGAASAPVIHFGYDDWQLPIAAHQAVNPFQLQDIRPDYFVSTTAASGTPPLQLKRPLDEQQDVEDDPQADYSNPVKMSSGVQVQIGFLTRFDQTPQAALESFVKQAQHVISTLEVQREEVPPCVSSSIKEYKPDALNTVTVLTPTIGQKSYGKEKRFFCPPPMAHFSGPEYVSLGQKRLKADVGQEFPKLSLSPDPSGFITAKDTGGVPSAISTADAQTKYVAAIFRGVHVGDLFSLRNESDQFQMNDLSLQSVWQSSLESTSRLLKRDFHMYLRVQKNAQVPVHVGTFESQNVCLISKPSKKKSSKPTPQRRSSIPNASHFSSDVIDNGCTVALYNRVKNQNVSTKCLAIESDGSLACKNVAWHPFTIESNSTPIEDNICDGSYIYLKSGKYKSEQFRVHVVVEQNHVLRPTEDALSHLQRVCLEYVQQPGQFLQIDTKSATLKRGQLKDSIADESLVWTIVGVATRSYQWFQPHSVSLPVTPVPELVAALVQQSADRTILAVDIHLPVFQWLELLDRVKHSMPLPEVLSQLNFSVYAGMQLCQLLHSECFLTLADGKHVPAIQALSMPKSAPQAVKIRAILQVPLVEEPQEVPILIIRRLDGVVYPTRSTLKYSDPGSSD